jgi:Fic family protein
MFKASEPFNELPLILPDSNNWEKLSIYKKVGEARAALAELKGRLPIIPNPYMLINTLVLQEAKDSSTIENIFTTNDKLYKAFATPSQLDKSTKEVLRYREAIWNGFNKLKSGNDFSLDLTVDIFQTLTEKKEEVRTGQVYIGNQFRVVYTPPEPKVLIDKLDNWFNVAVSNHQVDPLIIMAILHYQFESIHPFSDGNGRTGRILNVLFLTLQNLLDLPVIYLSKYILKNKNDYYRLLREVTENGNWEEWILYILEAVKQTSIFTLEKVNSIYGYYLQVIEKVKNKAPAIYSHELIEVMFYQPYTKISILEEKKIASRNTASKYLKKLEELGILASESVGREVLYKNVVLYDILSQS